MNMNESLLKQKEILEKFDYIVELDEKLLSIINSHDENWYKRYETAVESCIDLDMGSENLDIHIETLKKLIALAERLS
jgi:hypothetical protein